MTTVLKAIQKINPNAEVSINDNDVNQVTWHNGTAVISKADIQAKQAELQTAYDAEQYQRDREVEYPSWQDQMDMQYWDKINNTSTWQDAVQAVKDKYPKS